jgi:hypothetical protein
MYNYIVMYGAKKKKEEFIFSRTRNVVYIIFFRTNFMMLVLLGRSDGYSAEQGIFSLNRTRNFVTALAKVHRRGALWVIIIHSSPSDAFPFQLLSYVHISFPRKHYLALSFRSTCFKHSFPLWMTNARLKIYHRNSSTVSRNEGRKRFAPNHELSSTARIWVFIILAQILDISSFFSPMDFPIINCLQINT